MDFVFGAVLGAGTVALSLVFVKAALWIVHREETPTDRKELLRFEYGRLADATYLVIEKVKYKNLLEPRIEIVFVKLADVDYYQCLSKSRKARISLTPEEFSDLLAKIERMKENLPETVAVA